MAARNRSIPELMCWLECPYRHRLLYTRGLWPMKELRASWLYNGLARGTAELVKTGSVDDFFRAFSTRYLHDLTRTDTSVSTDGERLRKDLVWLHATLEAWAGSWEDPLGEWEAALTPLKRPTRGREIVWFWPLIQRGSGRPPLCWLPWDPGPVPGPIAGLFSYEAVEYGWPSTTELRSKLDVEGVPSLDYTDYSDRESFDAALESASDPDVDPLDYAAVREKLLPRSEALLLYRTVERNESTSATDQPLRMFGAIRNSTHGTWRNPTGGGCSRCGFWGHCSGEQSIAECAGKVEIGRMRGLERGVSIA